jgi:hypothetical protein
MKTANDFARIAAQCEQMAKQVKADPDDKYRDRQELIRYHLSCARAISRTLSEHIAGQEPKG